MPDIQAPATVNPVRPGTQNELTDHLAATIGADVERAMDSVGWRYTENTPTAPPLADPTTQVTAPSPPSNATVDNPTPAPQVGGTNAVNFEAYRDPKTGLILGKYKDPDAAVKGMHSLLHMANTALSAKDKAEENERLALERETQLRQQLQTRDRESSPSPSHVGDTTTVPELDAVRAKLKSGEGLDADEALKLIDGMTKYSELTVQKFIQEERSRQSATKQSWDKVDAYMQQHYPDSLNHADEMALYARTNPEVGRVFNRMLAMADTDEQARTDATIYLWKEYSMANPPSPIDPAAAAKEHSLKVANEVTKQEVDEARKHAGLLGSNAATGVHETSPNSTYSQEDIDRAAAYMKQTADGRLWRELTIGRDLKGPFFDNI